MLYVDGKAVGSGRAWARREGIVVPVDDAVAVAALEDAGQWDHVVLVGPSGTSAARAASAFTALDDLLAAAGPVLLFGGVDLPGRFRTAYADRATAAGEAPAVADRRDALLRALRATASGAPEDIAALGPPMRVTVGLFGAAATRRVGRALADAVGGGRWGAIQLATAASAILGPERLEPLLALEGDEPDVAVGPFADHLRDVLEPYTEIRRQTLLLDLWHEVTGHRDAVAARAHKRAWAAEIAGTQPEQPSAWLRAALATDLEGLSGDAVALAFGRPNWLATMAFEQGVRNAVAALALVMLAIAERDGEFDRQLVALDPLLNKIGESGADVRWSGPAVRRLTTLRVEEANRTGAPQPKVEPAELLWPPAERGSRLVGVGWEAAAAVEAVNDAVAWCRATPDRPSAWWSSLGWRPLIALDARRAVEGVGWSWRYWFAPNQLPPLAARVAAGGAVEDALDGLWLAQLADLIGELAGTPSIDIDGEEDRFCFHPAAEPPADPLRPLLTSAAGAVAGAAQLVRLGAEHPSSPRTWTALVDALLAVGAVGDAAAKGDLRYPPELASLHRRSLAGTDLHFVVPRQADEIVGWGTWMANCIGGYVDDVRAGRTFVFALCRDDDVPVLNLELSPGDEKYWLAECKARFNAEPTRAIAGAVERLVGTLDAPTRPWPPRTRPGPRHLRGGGGGGATDRARRPVIAEAVERASAAALAQADLSALLRLGAACGARDRTAAATAASIVRTAGDQRREVVAAALVDGTGALWSLVATDWIGAAVAALPSALAAESATLRLLSLDAPPRRRRGRSWTGGTSATATLRRVARAASAVAGALADLAERDDDRLADALASEVSPLTLALLLVRSATVGVGVHDVIVPVDASGLAATRPPTSVLDPTGPWATAWRVAGIARPAPVARLWRRMAVAGPAGALAVSPRWLGGTWRRWAARAAGPLAALSGGWEGVTARLGAIAADPGTPPAALAALAERRADLAALVAVNPAATPAVRRRLSRHVDPLVAAAACLHQAGAEDAAAWCVKAVSGTIAPAPDGDWPEALPSGLQVRLGAALAASPSPGVASLAARLARQPDVLAHLAEHPDALVRQIVAGRPATPPAAVVRLSTDTDISVCEAVAARRGRVPPEVVRALARHESGRVRGAIAARTDAPVAVLERLARDRAASVREAAIANPRLRPRAEAVEAADPATPASRLAALARSDLVTTRRLVAANPATPVDALAALGHLDSDPDVRAAAAARD